jgi:hypothetical protein
MVLRPFGFGSLGTGEFDHKLIRLDLHPDDMAVDKKLVLNLCSVEVSFDCPDNEGFDLLSRDPADGAGLLGASLQQSRR